MLSCIYQTADKGYIIGGVTASKDGDVIGNHGGADLWVIKLRADGSTHWRKALGGGKTEKGTIVHQTSDGGYIVGGITASSNGDVKGFRGGEGDIWVVKLNADGNLLWQKPIGGSALDEITTVLELPNSGGFIVGGTTSSANGDVTGFHGGKDYLVAKLSTDGRLIWSKVYGGSGTDQLHQIQLAADGGFVVAGVTWSNAVNDGDVEGFRGGSDIWIIKLDDSGKVLNKAIFGSSGLENWMTLQRTSDGGYVMGCEGGSKAANGDFTANAGAYGILLVRMDGALTVQWKTLFSSKSSGSILRGLKQTTDGGFIVGGSSGSASVPGNTYGGNGDAWLAKVAGNGIVQWQRLIGGAVQEEVIQLQETADGGYAATIMEFVKNSTPADQDVMVAKLNATGELLWKGSYGGKSIDWLAAGTGSVGTLLYQNMILEALWPDNKIQAEDKGYFFAVSTQSAELPGFHVSRFGTPYDIWVVKLKAAASYTTAVPVTELIDLQHRAYPNPFTTRATILFQAETNGPATVELYDAKGTRVATVFKGTVKAGSTYTFSVGEAALPRGIYTYRVMNGERRISGKLVKGGR